MAQIIAIKCQIFIRKYSIYKALYEWYIFCVIINYRQIFQFGSPLNYLYQAFKTTSSIM